MMHGCHLTGNVTLQPLTDYRPTVALLLEVQWGNKHPLLEAPGIALPELCKVPSNPFVYASSDFVVFLFLGGLRRRRNIS